MRIAMGIPSWSLLGHSFGGMLAIRYAAMFPNSIHKIIYEAPLFDVYYSFKSNFNLLHEYYCKNGDAVRAGYCLSSLRNSSRARENTDRYMKIPNGIGQGALDYLFSHSLNREEAVKNFVYPHVTEEMNEKSIKAAFKVMEDETFYQSNLELLDNIQAPSLLIAGKYDGVCDEYQKHYFETHSPHGKVIMFENSAHFISFDEPDKYTQEVSEFILY